MERKTYKVIKVYGKSKDEHRYIIEQKIGRKLHYNELVHHKNGNTKDNRIKNLEIISRSNHTRLHHILNTVYITLKCPVCKKEIELRKKFYEWKKNHNQKNFYCSKKCVALVNLNSLNEEYMKIIKKGLKEGLTGYNIAKRYNLNRTTVYNHIKRMKRDSGVAWNKS